MVYKYDESSGLLDSIVGGTSSVTYGYIGGTNLLKSIQVSEEDHFRFGMKIEMRYHFGLLKDQKISFDKDDKLVLDNVYTKLSYDGSARISGVTTQIGRQAKFCLEPSNNKNLLFLNLWDFQYCSIYRVL